MSKKYYYKVVFKDHAIGTHNYKSYFHNPLEIIYKKNSPTKAPEFNGVVCPIFAFDNIESAITFLKRYSTNKRHDKLFKCTGKLSPLHRTHIALRYMPAYKDNIAEFWKKINKELPLGCTMETPVGTILLDEITLLQEIEVL